MHAERKLLVIETRLDLLMLKRIVLNTAQLNGLVERDVETALNLIVGQELKPLKNANIGLKR